MRQRTQHIRVADGRARVRMTGQCVQRPRQQQILGGRRLIFRGDQAVRGLDYLARRSIRLEIADNAGRIC